MLVNGITPLNCKNSGKQKTFQNNRVKSHSQLAFRAQRISSGRFSDWFVTKCKRLCKLADAAWIKLKEADIEALRKAGESQDFMDTRRGDYNFLIGELKKGAEVKKVSIPEIDNGKKEFSSLRNYWAKHPQELEHDDYDRVQELIDNFMD